MRRYLGLVVAVLFMYSGSYGHAQQDEFYRNKTITMVVGYGPGGGYDLLARLFAKYYGVHIPGHPTIAVQNMPGAATLRATNYLANSAPKDGTVIASFDRNMPLIATIGGSQNVHFDPLELTWLGTLSDSTSDAFVLWARKRPDISTIKDMTGPGKPTLTVGVTGSGATDNDVAVLLKSVLGLNLRIVTGYEDSNAVGLAVDNGELDGQLMGYVASKLSKSAWLRPDSKMHILLQFARKTRLPELSEIPTAREMAPSAEARSLISLAELPYVFGRPIAAPPGIPESRARMLRDGFAATISDPGFINEAQRLNLALTPLAAKETYAAVEQLGKSPIELRNRLRDILYGPPK